MFVQKRDMAKALIHQKGLGLRDAIRGDVDADYGSRLVDWLRANDYTCTSGRVTVRLARAFGFCYGVERAVDYAYETVRMYPDRRIHLVGEIIHNPAVNDRLSSLGVAILPGHRLDDPSYDAILADDVVIIPAFGTTMELFARLKAKGCVLVDTTCGSVMNVWKRVRQYAKSGYTSVVHGKANHEETRATCSQATSLGGHYLVLLDLEEARAVAEFIRRGGSRSEFTARFSGAFSDAFDPGRDLCRIGLANQTTMLSSESLEVAEILRRAMADRYGEEHLGGVFMSFDTICGATQDRQDAVVEMLNTPPDLMLIVGGYNSSNTTHLVEIASGAVPTYFIRDASLIESGGRIRHRDVAAGREVVTDGWLPEGPIAVGITAGASCPDNQIGATILRVLEVAGVPPPR
jgi:4-hydroxy-3-methylbut-2-enyl diphosphate reductase